MFAHSIFSRRVFNIPAGEEYMFLIEKRLSYHVRSDLNQMEEFTSKTLFPESSSLSDVGRRGLVFWKKKFK